MTCERKEKPRIANSDPIGKPKASGCWGKLFIDSMWLIQISKVGKIMDKKSLMHHFQMLCLHLESDISFPAIKL